MYLYIVISKKVWQIKTLERKKTLTLMCYKKVKFKTGQKLKTFEIIF